MGILRDELGRSLQRDDYCGDKRSFILFSLSSGKRDNWWTIVDKDEERSIGESIFGYLLSIFEESSGWLDKDDDDLLPKVKDSSERVPWKKLVETTGRNGLSIFTRVP